MARELYNWDKSRGYLKLAMANVIKKHNEINPIIIEEVVAEYDTLQTMYGKESIEGLANRIMKQLRKQHFYFFNTYS